LTPGETLAAAVVVTLASTIAAAYGLDRAGGGFTPAVMLPVTAGAALASLAWLVRRRERAARSETVGFAAVVGGAFVWLLWIARPWLLPLGRGADLTHHLLLVGYIERHWSLVHDPGVEAYLGEMVSYTPGLHILAALAGAWSGGDGLHALHPLVSATVALKAGLVYLVVLRLLPCGVPRAALAAVAALLLLLPRAYVLGSFTQYSFLAQVAAELFAVAMWWALVVWDQTPRPGAALLFGVAAVGAFLTWPIWTGPPAVALGLTLLVRREPDAATRLRHGVLALAPLAIVAAVYVAGRSAGWLQMAGAGGDVLRPLAAEYGFPFLVLAAMGLALAPGERAARATLLFIAGIALQAGVLYVRSLASGETSFYMAFKTFYLFPYPLAAVAILPPARAWLAVARLGQAPRAAALTRRVPSAGLAAALVACVAYAVVRPLAREPREAPALTGPLLLAGAWARAHVPPACVEYLVADDDAAYWLHLAVLGNPRWSARTAADTTYDFEDAVVRWLAREGLPYAIAELPALTSDVRAELDVVASFGDAAVVRRRGRVVCEHAAAPDGRP
jgi:hypothetical protein